MCENRHACRRCAEVFLPGEAYYAVPGLGAFCPDCGEALLESWRRREGDVTDRI